MLLDSSYKAFKTKAKRSDLGKELAKLQRRMLASEAKISLIIMVEGWESSGRGRVMLDIVRELDQRYVHAYPDNGDSHTWPFMHALWDGLPPYGETTIFSRSVYAELFGTLGLEDELLDDYAEIYHNAAKTLYDDHVILVKFFLDVSQETQRKRIEKSYADPYLHLYVGPQDLRESSRYQVMRQHYDRILDKTNFDFSPWHIINAEDSDSAGAEALTILLDEVAKGIDRIEGQVPEVKRTYMEEKHILDDIPTEGSMSRGDYDDQLEDLQEQAADLQLQLKARNIPTVIAFEGMDAGGKGGSIKRLTRLMDPRFTFVSTTAAPKQFENAHNYLWRFYQAFPQYGNMTIFDRSWYGRVLVERIEGFARPDEWERAYQEINQMEEELYRHNCLVLKYYIHISKDEQKARFEARMADKDKHYKITDEDWRNRDKWDRYWEATNEMLVRTSTPYAPWQVVPGDNKRFARIFILKDFIKRAEEALDNYSPWSLANLSN